VNAVGARVVLATRNEHKVTELRAILADALSAVGHGEVDLDRAVVGLDAFDVPDVVESGVTFAENALLKASAAARATGLAAVADDSGLAVDVLGGAPGVFSARWCGRHGDDGANLDLLLAQLVDVPDGHRGARFVCAVALVLPDGSQHVEQGELVGELLHAPAGDNGFGYDPVLRPAGSPLSCAERTPEQKNAISHRGQAVRAMVPRLLPLLSG